MTGTKYLSELVNFDVLAPDRLNLIEAPTGCGKSYFALSEIPKHCKDTKHEAVYLIDTINGRD